MLLYFMKPSPKSQLGKYYELINKWNINIIIIISYHSMPLPDQMNYANIRQKKINFINK